MTDDTDKITTLNRANIIKAAVDLVERDGVKRLTVRALGQELQKDPTAFYRHFRSKQDLLIALTDHVLGDVLDGYAPSETWEESLADVMRRGRAVYLRHPNLSGAIAASPEGTLSNARVYEQILRILVRAGLADSDIPRFADLISQWVISVSSREAASVSSAADADPEAVAARSMFSRLDPTEFAFCVRFARHLFPDPDTSFESGIDLMVESIRRAAVPSG